MIIPVRCFTCNKVISDKWVPFVNIVNEKKKNNSEFIKDLDIEYIDLKNPSAALDRLRSTIKAEKYPILTQHNQRIADAIQDLDLTIPIKWDQTLENKYLSLDLHITHIEQLKPLLDLLKEKEVDIGRILDQL